MASPFGGARPDVLRLAAEGMPVRAVAEALGISRQRVDQILKSEGMATPPGTDTTRARQVIVRRLRRGDNRAAIARDLGVPYTSVVAIHNRLRRKD